MTKKLTRRAALGAIASIPATGAATAALAAPDSVKPERIVERRDRLAKELAYALDDWDADCEAGGCSRLQWGAMVWPASAGRGILFGDLNQLMLRPEPEADSPIMTLFREWETLFNSYDPAVDENADRKPSEAYNARMDLCYDIANQMEALPSTSATDFAAKLIVITGYGDFGLERAGPTYAEAIALTGTVWSHPVVD